jgi:hypothetical protein
MNFYIINTSLFNLHLNGTHILSNRKFAEGFKQNGYNVIEILNDNELNKIENNKGNIIILSNFIDFNSSWDEIIEFGKKYDNLFYILWCWHASPAEPPFKYYIYTFSEYLLEPSNEKFKNEYFLFKDLEKNKKFIPYRFSSYINPNINYKEKNDSEKKEIDCIYIGSPYEIDKIEFIKNTNYNHFIHIFSPGSSKPITGETFEKLYRRSKICFGFISDGNILTNTVTERIWEAFSFGCLVLTNSKTAEIISNGAAIYYKDLDDFKVKLDYYIKNDNERISKINEGYKIFEKRGNYKSNSKEFIDHLNNVINK